MLHKYGGPDLTMKILDEVWMLVHKDSDEVIYAIDGSASGVWKKVVDEEVMGTGITTAMLWRQGFRAKKVSICDDMAKK